MPARFIYLENTGHPTSWDATRYAEYLKKLQARLPSDLQSLTAIERLKLPSMSEHSFWWTEVTDIQVGGDTIKIGAANEEKARSYEFVYSGVCKFQTTLSRLYFKPTLIMQELVLLRNGVLRHTFSDMGGDLTTIHASSLSFQESVIQ
jgi:hypothetical protein